MGGWMHSGAWRPQRAARAGLRKVLELAEWQGLVSSEHFTVDGTLIEAWASMKSFRPKDGSGEPPAPGSDLLVTNGLVHDEVLETLGDYADRSNASSRSSSR